PGIAAAPGEDLELVPRRMIPPDAGVESDAIGIGRAWFSDARMRKHAVTPVEPTVGSPDKRVERFVRILVAEPVEQHLWLAVRLVVAVAIGDEQQVRGRPDPHAAETDFQSTDEVQPFHKHLARIERAVAV